MEITKFGLVTRDNIDDGELHDTLDAARTANDGKHAIVKYTFELKDSDLVELPDGSQPGFGEVWPPDEEPDDAVKAERTEHWKVVRRYPSPRWLAGYHPTRDSALTESDDLVRRDAERGIHCTVYEVVSVWPSEEDIANDPAGIVGRDT